MSEVVSAHAYYFTAGAGLSRPDFARCWGGTKTQKGRCLQACAHALRLVASSVRACVRVCVWSQFPPSAALPD